MIDIFFVTSLICFGLYFWGAAARADRRSLAIRQELSERAIETSQRIDAEKVELYKAIRVVSDEVFKLKTSIRQCPRCGYETRRSGNFCPACGHFIACDQSAVEFVGLLSERQIRNESYPSSRNRNAG